MWVRGREEFWSKVYKGDSEEKKFGLFLRKYFMDGTLAKNSTTNISEKYWGRGREVGYLGVYKKMLANLVS